MSNVSTCTFKPSCPPQWCQAYRCPLYIQLTNKQLEYVRSTQYEVAMKIVKIQFEQQGKIIFKNSCGILLLIGPLYSVSRTSSLSYLDRYLQGCSTPPSGTYWTQAENTCISFYQDLFCSTTSLLVWLSSCDENKFPGIIRRVVSGFLYLQRLYIYDGL